jgi:hypothetical protein
MFKLCISSYVCTNYESCPNSCFCLSSSEDDSSLGLDVGLLRGASGPSSELESSELSSFPLPFLGLAITSSSSSGESSSSSPRVVLTKASSCSSSLSRAFLKDPSSG